MRKRMIVLVLALLCMSFSLQAYAADEDSISLTGSLEEKISYLHADGDWASLLTAELGIGYDYGDDARFYLHPALSYQTILGEEGTLNWQLREGYVDLYLRDMDLRIGRQLVNWGSGYKLNPTDFVNPMDLTAADPTAADLGVAAIKGDYYLGQDWMFSGVVIGEFVPAKLPEAMQSLPAQTIREALYQQMLGYISDPATVEMMLQNLDFATNQPEVKGLADLEYACKVTRRDLLGYDLSLSFFHGYEDYPSLHSNMPVVVQTLLAGQPATVEFTYPRTNSFGLDLIGEVRGVGVWSEASFSINDAEQQKLEAVLGADYTFRNSLYMVGQWYHRHPLNIEGEEQQNYLLLYGQLPIRQIHQVSTTMMYDLGEAAVMLNPEFKLSLYDNLDLKIGTVWVHGLQAPSQSLLSNFGSNQTYLGIGYGF